jgi:hypothetical protein
LKRVVSLAVVLLLVALLLPALPLHADSTPVVNLNSQYVLNRYGYAIINETVSLSNNGSSALQVPDIQFGFGNLTTSIASYNVTGTGYSVTTSETSQGQVYVVSGGALSLPAGGNSTFSFKAVTYNLASKTKNGTLALNLLTSPYVSLTAHSAKLVIKMPASTQFKSSPAGYTQSYAGTNVTYYRTIADLAPQPALTRESLIAQYTGQDFHPLIVYSAERLLTVSADGTPTVEDSITLGNEGTTPLNTLYVSPLASPDAQVTILPSASPPLLNPTSIHMSKDGMDLTGSTVSLAVDAGANLSITYQYPLDHGYYNASGGTVTLSIPLSPPIRTYVDSYSIRMSAPTGVRLVSGAQQNLANVGPYNRGETAFSYDLSPAWALSDGVPVASFVFVVALIGLFGASVAGLGVEEEEAEETATDLASDMVKAFEEKTSLINGFFEEIPHADPNQLNKAYFDELRSRLDAFRGRALQRLNELKQKSVSTKFFDLLAQIHETEREVDRAAKDMINLYEQFYTRRMRKEVYDRLLPNYKKRLEKTLNQLSDELNVAQREAKLL